MKFWIKFYKIFITFFSKYFLLLPVMLFSKGYASGILCLWLIADIMLRYCLKNNYIAHGSSLCNMLHNFYNSTSAVNNEPDNSAPDAKMIPKSARELITDFNFATIAAIFACYLFSSSIAFIALLVNFLGSQCSDYVHIHYGKHPLGYLNKSLEGSLTMCMVTALILTVMPIITGNGHLSYKIIIIASLVISFLEMSESQRFKLEDNISITLLTGLIIQLYL